MNEKEICEVFAKNLNALMAEHDVKKVDIVSRLNASKGIVSAWCSGDNLPRTKYLAGLCNMFGVELSDLLLDKSGAKSTASPSDLSLEEQRVITAYRQASEERRQIADDILLPKQ